MNDLKAFSRKKAQKAQNALIKVSVPFVLL
jgi:hypothetical protein